MPESHISKRHQQTWLEQAEYIVERVRSLGVRVHPSSRLMLMLQTLKRGHIDWDDRHRFLVALESIRDMNQVRLIVDEMDTHRDNPKFCEFVQKLMNDAALPQNSGDETPGRDTQFELYLAAVCLRGNLLPVEYCEPDVTCVVGGKTFGIAAKRLKSLERFEERLKEAADQIHRSGLPGIIAIDWTIARNPENKPIRSGIQSQHSTWISHEKTRTFLGKFEQDIYRWVEGTGVRAILVFEYVYRVNPESTRWINDGNMCWFETTRGDPSAEQELVVFQEGFKRGMPNLVELTVDE